MNRLAMRLARALAQNKLVNAALVQQHDETARYGCESAPNYTGKKKGATPQFRVVALLGGSSK
jgi:hypothetical protein